MDMTRAHPTTDLMRSSMPTGSAFRSRLQAVILHEALSFSIDDTHL